MNCRQYQAQITDALAHGSEPLSTPLAVHANSCSTCREFHTKRKTLFRSIDAELHSLVNYPVPPSLLPLVRDNVHQSVEVRRWTSSAWSLLATTAALIIIFSSASKFHSSITDRNVPQNLEASAPAARATVPPQPTVNISPVHRGGLSRNGARGSSPEVSEVIVLPDAQKAFARFLAQVPEHQQATLALTRPTTLESVVPVEIAPLQIATLEVKPLEGSEAE